MFRNATSFLIAWLIIASMVGVAEGTISIAVLPNTVTVSQGTVANYTVSISGAHDGVSLKIQGLPESTSYRFLPATLTGSGTSTLQIETNTLCPGTYNLLLTANDGEGTASVPAGLSVTYAGPPLSVSIWTDRPSYAVGEVATIFISVNRPAQATLTLTSTTGPPQTRNISFLNPGVYNFSATIDEPAGTRSAVVEVSACNEHASSTTYFEVRPLTYSITITVDGFPSNYAANMTVDGRASGSLAGGQSRTLSFQIGSFHIINVSSIVPGGEGVRYYTDSPSWSFNSADSHIFHYKAQYELLIESDPDSVPMKKGTEWYDVGESFTSQTVPEIIAGEVGTRYLFEAWLLDGKELMENPFTTEMNAPHVLTARFRTQYFLTINSENGNPQGSGWYDKGSKAEFSVELHTGILISQVFVSWTGDYSGTETAGTIRMDSPKTITAVWRTDYTQLIVFVGSLVGLTAFFLILRRRREGSTV